MQLQNHKMTDVAYQAAKHIYGHITPEIVVLHDTSGRLDKGNSANFLADNKAGVSVQFVIERDGTITQQVPTNRRAGHAGKSSFQGRGDCNGFSIGIEIVNLGRLRRVSDTQAVSWFKKRYDITEQRIEEITTAEHGHGLWQDYTEEQMDALYELLVALFDGIPTLRDITTHWQISPGRKVDTNPLFELESLRSRILGRDDPADIIAEAKSTQSSGDQYVEIDVRKGGNLNMRKWPSFERNVLRSIPDCTPVSVIRSGLFTNDGQREQWHLVRYDQLEGWIVARLTSEITTS